MALTKEDVTHIAELARLDLRAEEIEHYQNDLTRIFDYISQLQEVNTDQVEPSAQVTGLTNRFREDIPQPTDAATRERLLNAAPEREGDYLKVKAVFE